MDANDALGYLMTRVFASLRARLVFLVLLAVIPAMCLVVNSATEQRRLITLRTQEDAIRVANSAARVQEQLIESTRQFLTAVAQFPSVRGSDVMACNQLLATLSIQNPQYCDLSVSNSQGDIICSSPPITRPFNISNDSFVPHVIETRDFAVGEYRLGRGNSPVLGFGYPLIDEPGHARGVVIAAYYLTTLNKIAAETSMPPDSTLTVRDRKGVIVARYPEPEKWLGKAVPDASGVPALGRTGIDGTVEAVGADGVPRLYAASTVRSVPVNDLVVTVGIPTSVAYAQVNQLLQRDLIFLGLIGAIALAAAWFGGDWFLLRHVHALANVTRRMADGDLTARTGLRYGVGELSQLARSFDRMVDMVEQREVALRQAEDRVRRWASHLEGLITVVAESTTQPLDASKIVDIALSRTLGIMRLDAGCVLLKRDHADWALAAHNGLDDTVVQSIQKGNAAPPATNELTDWANSDTVLELDRQAFPEALAPLGAAFPAWVGVPIKSKGHAYGVLLLAGLKRQVLDPEDQRVLCAAGQQLAVAIENAELYAQVKSIAALKERERLGRELHDGLAQVLGYLAMKNKLATDLIARGQLDRAVQEMHDIQQSIEASCRDIRESILGLRVTVAPNGGLLAALREYVQKYSIQTGIHLTLSAIDDDLTFAPETEVQLLRIIQEALGNIRKHSGAWQGSIRFGRQGNLSIITIEDRGKGFDTERIGADGLPHFGLQTMRERAESVGGSLQVNSRPGQGTRVVVTLPMSEGG